MKILIIGLLFVVALFSVYKKNLFSDSIWRSYLFFKNNYHKIFDIFQSSSVRSGKELILFTQITISSFQNISKHEGHLKTIPEYKYFSNLMAELFSLQKKFGVNIQKQVLTLRNSLGLDVQFEEEVGELVQGQLLQLALGNFAVISLCFIAQNLLGFSAQLLNILLIFWQSLGLFLAWFFAKKMSRKNTLALYLSFKFLCKMDIYSGVLVSSTSLTQNLNQSELTFLKSLPDYHFLGTGLEQLISAWIKNGSSPAPMLGLYYAEWEFRQKKTLIKLKKDLSVLSFVMLIAFNLIPYLFLVLFLLFSKFKA